MNHKQGKYKIEQIIDIKNFGKKLKIGKDEIKITNYKKFNWLKKINRQTLLFVAIGDNFLRRKIVNEIKKRIKKLNGLQLFRLMQ